MTQKKEDEAKLIEHMLSEVEAHLEEADRTNNFIESLRDSFDERGTLSPAQVEGLRKFYERI